MKMTSSWVSFPKRGLVPPALLYCEHDPTKIGAKSSLLKICTLHGVYSHLSATLYRPESTSNSEISALMMNDEPIRHTLKKHKCVVHIPLEGLHYHDRTVTPSSAPNTAAPVLSLF